MKTLVILALMMQQVPPDAPVKEEEPVVLLNIRPIMKGEPAPYDGVWMDDVAVIAIARRTHECELERDALRKEDSVSIKEDAPWWIVGVAVASFAVGVGATWVVLRK